MSFSKEEIEEFRTEALELLENADQSLLALDKGEGLSTHYDSIFRVFHSLKGASGLMEMSDLQAHMHKLENILVEQKPKTQLPKAVADMFLRGTEAARKLLRGEQVNFNYTISEATIPSTPVAKKLDQEKGRIVVVDDEPDIVEIVSEELASAGLEVRGTTKSEEVMKLIEEFKPNAVLSDISMPRLDGQQLLSLIAKSYPDLPVVFLSGHVSKETLMKAIASGIYAVLEKPANGTQLISTCVNAVSRNQMSRLLNKSINLLLYQYSDLNEFLKRSGKADVQKVIETEMNNILIQRRKLRHLTEK